MNAIARKRVEYRNMSGPDKAAVLMLALGEERAASIFRLLEDGEIRTLSMAMANLGAVDAAVVERVCNDFAGELSSTAGLIGTYESTERLLKSVMGRGKADQIMDDIRGPAGRTMWEKLANVNEAVLANYLKNEYPQTVAVVLSKVKPEHAASVLGLLPESFAVEVVMRMLRMETVQKEVLDDVERTLRTELMSNRAQTARRDSHEMLAEIFNNFDRGIEAKFMTALEERSRDAAQRIRALMFTFEDLARLDPQGIQTLMRSVDKDKMSIALKGASEQLRTLFLSNMSERAGKLLREEMGAMGPVRLKDVDEAQQYLVQTAKDLSARGEIVLAEGGDDELVY